MERSIKYARNINKSDGVALNKLFNWYIAL